MEYNQIHGGITVSNRSGSAAEGFNFSSWRDLPPPSDAKTYHSDLDPDPFKVGWLDRVMGALALLIVSPVIAAVALVVKLDCPRAPVFYRQERVGLDRRRGSENGAQSPGGHPERRNRSGNGKSFMIWKFRTMIPDAEAKTGPVWASENDPRITKVGRLLRQMRLDELPQLINVVQGQMRMIGPRPERPHFVQKLIDHIPDYRKRLAVPPGITGLAQIHREYDADVDDVRTKLGYDLFYVDHRSHLLDLKILIKTVEVVLRGRGAR